MKTLTQPLRVLVAGLSSGRELRFRSAGKSPERRARAGLELRAITDDEKTAGYIGALEGDIPFNSDSEELRDRSVNNGRPFVERMAPDVFKRSLTEDKDQMGFAGHTDDPLKAFAVVGENLTITTDDKGLHYRALVPDTQAGKDLLRLVKNKIIRGTSFEFNVRGSGEKWEKRDGLDVRTITEARLYTVNPVAWPAYPDSELTAERGRNRQSSRRSAYFGSDVGYDPTITDDAAYAIESLGSELCELIDALDYLRENPAGAMAAYARQEATDATAAIAMLSAWLNENGATLNPDLVQRAKTAMTEARDKLSPPTTDSDRERRRRLLKLAPGQS